MVGAWAHECVRLNGCIERADVWKASGDYTRKTCVLAEGWVAEDRPSSRAVKRANGPGMGGRGGPFVLPRYFLPRHSPLMRESHARNAKKERREQGAKTRAEMRRSRQTGQEGVRGARESMDVRGARVRRQRPLLYSPLMRESHARNVKKERRQQGAKTRAEMGRSRQTG